MLESHLAFYSGSDRKQIFQAFVRLVDALRRDDFSELSQIATADCVAETSVAGRLEGTRGITHGLSWPGPPGGVSRATMLNFVARSRANRAVQTAYVQCVRGYEHQGGVDAFLYGLQFHNEFTLEDGSWKLSHLRLDLCYESGNNDFVRGKWRLMDYGTYAGHAPMILPELHNPWNVVPDDSEPQSDQEQVFELMFKYAFAFDHGDFAFLLSFVTPDFAIKSSLMRGEYGDEGGVGSVRGADEVIPYLKAIFHSEAKLMHAFRMSDVQIADGLASATALRGEDHRLRNAKVGRHNLHSVFTTAVHSMRAVRDVDKGWRMDEYRVEPVSARATRTPDGWVAYDELLSGK